MQKEGEILVKKLRKARAGMTQTAVCRVLKMSQAVLSKIENGIREPTAIELKKMATLYKKPLSYFFEEETEDILELLEDYFKRRAVKLNIEMAFLFGSFAGGNPNSFSDVDIGIVFGNEISMTKRLDALSQISLDVGKALNREVNVTTLDLESWQPMFYYNIIVLGRSLFVRDKNKLPYLKWEAVRQMEEFMVFGVNMQIAAAQSNLRRL